MSGDSMSPEGVPLSADTTLNRLSKEIADHTASSARWAGVRQPLTKVWGRWTDKLSFSVFGCQRAG